MSQLTVQQLAATRSVAGHDVNPLTGALVFTWHAGAEPSLYYLPDDEGDPRPLLGGEGQHAAWAHHPERLVFLRDETGAETDDLFLLDVARRETHNLTSDSHSYTWPRFSTTNTLAVISNREGTFDPYLLDVAEGTFRCCASGTRAASSLVWSPQGRYLGFFRLAAPDTEGNPQSSLHFYDTETGDTRDLGMLSGDLFHADWSWKASAADNEPVLCVPADHGEYQGLLLVTLTGKRRWMDSGQGDKSQPQWTADGARLVYLQEGTGNRRLCVFDEEGGRTIDLSIGEGVHQQPRWAPDGRSLTVIFQSASSPPDLWRVTLEGEQKRLTNGLPDDFPAGALTQARHITYPAWDGQYIPALLYQPAEPTGQAIVVVHGGPTANHRNEWRSDIQLLTSRGYTILAPNVRGSTGYGKTFRDLNRMDWGGGDLRDLESANRYLRERGVQQIGIMGESYGGYLTLMALTQQPALWDAGAALYPIANLGTLYESSRPSDIRPYLEDQIGTPAARPEFYHERSPVHFVDNVGAPLLLLQGENDIRTPLAEVQQMAERLDAADKEYQMHIYPNEGHGFRRRTTQEDALQRVVAFFDRYLGDLQ